MNKPPSRRKKVLPRASEEPKPAADSAKENNSGQDNPASATITVTAVEIRELTEEEQSLRLHLERRVERAFLEAGQALMELRDRRLYRSTHRTFEEYGVTVPKRENCTLRLKPFPHKHFSHQFSIIPVSDIEPR